MDDIPFFPVEYWVNKTLEVSSPMGTWKLTEKIGEKAVIRQRRSMQELGSRSYGRAEFRCQNLANPDLEALVTVYLQLPLRESMGLPPALRRSEATDSQHRDFEQLLEAYQRLTIHNCEFTPRFFGFSHGRQGDDGLVPDGFISYLVYSSVPGIPLGSGTIGLDFGGFDVAGGPRAVLALSEEEQTRCSKYTIPDGAFWAFSAEKRALIRQQFEAAFT